MGGLYGFVFKTCLWRVVLGRLGAHLPSFSRSRASARYCLWTSGPLLEASPLPFLLRQQYWQNFPCCKPAAEAVGYASQLNPHVVGEVFCHSGGGMDPAEEWELQFEQAAVAFPSRVLKFFSRWKSIGLLSSCLSGVVFIALHYK